MIEIICLGYLAFMSVMGYGGVVWMKDKHEEQYFVNTPRADYVGFVNNVKHPIFGDIKTDLFIDMGNGNDKFECKNGDKCEEVIVGSKITLNCINTKKDCVLIINK